MDPRGWDSLNSTVSKYSPCGAQIAHTWTPYCCAAPLDVAAPCLWQSLRIYTTVYLVSAFTV